MKNIFNIAAAVLMIFLLIFFLAQDMKSEIYYPWKNVYIGAFDAEAWAGLVLAPQKDSLFAFRLRIEKDEETADGMDLYYLVSEVGPHSPDGQYARLKFDLSLPFGMQNETPILKKPSRKSDTMTLEWSRKDEGIVVGKIRIPSDIVLHLIHYFPWNFRGRYQISSEGDIKGESSSLDNYSYLFWTSRSGDISPESKEEELILTFPTDEMTDIYFVAGVGSDPKLLSDQMYRYKNGKTIETILLEESRRYMKKRAQAVGLYRGVLPAITNNIFWMSLYQPGHHRLYTPAGRRWIFPKPDGSPDHWTIFEWDSFFNALELSVESTKHARDVLMSVLETQYPNGNIPNWRGRFGGAGDRSQPPVGTYVVLKYFLKSADMDLLRYAYPYLKKWHDFWKEEKEGGQPRRDGNRDGLLEWGSDEELISLYVPSWEENEPGLQRAMWESGQDDLPNWDGVGYDEEAGTMTMNCLDLNSLYALDAYCLSEIASVLNKTEDAEIYRAEYETMKVLINDHFWSEKDGFYFDRHWDGRFSTKKAASNFYPLIAKIPSQEQAMSMIRHLLNPEEFWGDYIIPTISRDDPTFQDQAYWRGRVWPPTNYLVYQGLKTYGFDVVASEFARKSSNLFLRSWENFQLCPENFDSRTGEAGGQSEQRRYQSWGPLLALISVEEYLDFTPWEGFRFGMLDPEKGGRITRISVQGRHYDVEVSRSATILDEEGKEIIKTSRPAIFRHFLYSETDVSFEVKSLEQNAVRINFLARGKYQYWIDDQIQKPFEGKSLRISIPEGEHSVLILLLEKKD
jgi:hypothetical protein